MKATKRLRQTAIHLLLLLSGPIFSQAPPGPSELGVIPAYKVNEENLFFIDAGFGELVSYALLKEPILDVAMGKETDIFYAMTRHFLFKGSVSTGEILDEYQFIDLLKQQEGELVDPNLQILPMGLTDEGKAIFVHNSEVREMMLEMQEIDDPFSDERKKLYYAILEKGKFSETYLADIESKTTNLHSNDVYNSDKEVLFEVTEDGNLVSFDQVEKNIIVRNITTKETRMLSTAFLLEDLPEIDWRMYYFWGPSYSQQLTDDVYSLAFGSLTGDMTGVSVVFDATEKQVLETRKTTSIAEATPSLRYASSTSILINGKKNCSVEPMPTPPEFPTSTKKRMSRKEQREMSKRIDEISEEFDAKLAAWSKKAQNPQDQCNLIVYKDPGSSEAILEITKAMEATVYNNNYLFVHRGFEASLYDFESQSLLWTVDLNF